MSIAILHPISLPITQSSTIIVRGLKTKTQYKSYSHARQSEFSPTCQLSNLLRERKRELREYSTRDPPRKIESGHVSRNQIHPPCYRRVSLIRDVKNLYDVTICARFFFFFLRDESKRWGASSIRSTKPLSHRW